MLENEKKEKNVTVDKIKSLFKKIKNFNQLKEEVCDIKNLCQVNSDDINKIKEKYSKLNNRKDFFNFEEMQDEAHYRELFEEKINEYDKKFNIILGDNFKVDDFDENEFNKNIINDMSKDKNDNKNKKDNINANILSTTKEKSHDNNKNNYNKENINQGSPSKHKKGKKKLFNLLELNKQIMQYQHPKVNSENFEQKNEENKINLNELDKKLNEIYNTLYITNNKKDITENDISNHKFNFTTKNEFENYKIKVDEEIDKLWEEILTLKKQYEEFTYNLKNKCTLEDLDSMKNVILEKSQELFLKLKINNANKDSDSTAIHILQKNFKKLVELLADKEEKENENWLLAKKPMGHSCASCENFLGSLNDDTNRYVPWKKMPPKEKDNNTNDKIYKIGNGYSRLLKMIHFDKKGIPILRPYEHMNNSFSNNNTNDHNNNNKSKSKEYNDDNNGSIQSIHCINSKNKSKDNKDNNNQQTILIAKTRNKETEIKGQKALPNIKNMNSTDYFEKTGNKMNMSLNNFKFKSPRITRDFRKSYNKFDL